MISQGAFADLVVCFTAFSKNLRFQKKSLAAIETLKSTVPRMMRTPECPLSHRPGTTINGDDEGGGVPKLISRQTQEEQFWFPVLFAFHDILMTGDDLEVRSQYVVPNLSSEWNLTHPAEPRRTFSTFSKSMEVIFRLSFGMSCGDKFYIQYSWYCGQIQK